MMLWPAHQGVLTPLDKEWYQSQFGPDWVSDIRAAVARIDAQRLQSRSAPREAEGHPPGVTLEHYWPPIARCSEEVKARATPASPRSKN